VLVLPDGTAIRVSRKLEIRSLPAKELAAELAAAADENMQVSRANSRRIENE
jgi:hypothetical protein